MASEDKFSEIMVNKFTEESAREFRRKVIQQASLDPNMPICIYIDSYGGYIDSLNSMLETMEQISNPKITICIGKAMSCGAVLLAAGDYRFCGSRSRVMIHQGSSGAGGPIEGLQNDVDEAKRQNRQLMALLAKRCNMTLQAFKAEMKRRLHKNDDESRDMYLDAKNALEIGIVDYIGMPLVKPRISYTVDIAPEREYEPIQDEELKVDQKTESKTKKKTKKKITKKKTTRKKTKRSSGGNK